MHTIFQNKAYCRRQLQQTKAIPLLDTIGVSSFIESVENLQKHAD